MSIPGGQTAEGVFGFRSLAELAVEKWQQWISVTLRLRASRKIGRISVSGVSVAEVGEKAAPAGRCWGGARKPQQVGRERWWEGLWRNRGEEHFYASASTSLVEV